jgi:hypothetical protein
VFAIKRPAKLGGRTLVASIVFHLGPSIGFRAEHPLDLLAEVHVGIVKVKSKSNSESRNQCGRFPVEVPQGIPIPEWERTQVCKHEVVGESRSCMTMLCLNRRKRKAEEITVYEGKSGIIWGR